MNVHTTGILIEEFSEAVAEATGIPPKVIHKHKPAHRAYQPDFVGLEHEGGLFRFVIEAKRSLFPRDAREAIWQLKHYLAHDEAADRSVVPMLIAETISPVRANCSATSA